MTEHRRALALLAAGAAVTAVFVSRFAPARLLFLEIVPPALAAIAILLACYAVGVGALRLSGAGRRAEGRGQRAEAESQSESVTIPPPSALCPPPSFLLEALLIGFPTFGTLIAIIAWIGVALDAVTIVVTAIAAVAGAVLLLRESLDRPRLPLLLAIPIALGCIQAIVPVSSPDEMIYKLGVPHLYRLFGRMLELPLNSNSYLALAPHFTDLAGLIAAGGTAARLARFAIYLAALAALVRYGRRLAGEGGALVGTWPATVIAWTPALMLLAGWCWDEWIVIGLLVVSIDHWTRTPRSPVIAFAALGAAVACKYSALPWLAAFAVVVLWRERRLALRGALLIVAFGGFFYLRNAVWTGSPLTPLFEPNAPRVMNYRSDETFGGFRDLARGLDIFDPHLVDESLGILLPVAALASLLALRRRDLRDLIVIGALQMPVLLAIAPGSRNVVNGFVALAIPGAVVMIETWRAAGRWWRAALGTLAAAAMAAQLVLVVFAYETYEPLPYLAGRETARQYIARLHDFAKPYAYIEATTPRSARILLLGEIHVFHLDRQALAGGNHDGARIASWLARFPSADALHAEWRRQGVTHVLLRKSRFRVATGQPLSAIDREVVLEVPPNTHALVTETLKTRAVLRYRDADYLVFELR